MRRFRNQTSGVPAQILRLPLFRLLLLLVAALPGWCAQAVPQGGDAIQTVVLDPSRPLYIPTHPRVTTTVRFPGPVGSPEGRGFTENEESHPGEYLVTWTRGDAYFTVCPLEGAGPLNLNVPYQNSTYVLFFYPTETPTKALACLNLSKAQGDAPPAAAPARLNNPPPAPAKAILDPARGLGLIDRMKALAAQRTGPGATQTALGLKLLIPQEGELRLFDHGSYELEVLSLYQDEHLGACGLRLRIKNKVTKELALDASGFVLRIGAQLFPSASADAPERLAAGESREAFLCFATGRALGPSALRRFVLSAQLRTRIDNPGASLVERFSGTPP